MRVGLALAAAGLAAPVLAFAPPGLASPQILALLSTDGPVPLVCEGSACTAELSAFCLEEKRATPETGTIYRAAPRGGIVLIVTAGDGSVREVDGEPHAVFSSLRDMTAVRVRIDRRRLGDAVRVSIRAGEASALLPMTEGSHGTPHTVAEVARATGPMRSKAARIVDRDPGAVVARDLSRTLSQLRPEDESGEGLVTGAAAPLVRACAGAVAEEKSRRQTTVGIYGYWTGRSIVSEPSLKACLEAAHGTLMTALNRRYWRGEAAIGAAPTPPPRM